MKRVVIDTNVLVAAEAGACAHIETHVDLKCQLDALLRLQRVRTDKVKICLDYGREIWGEYERKIYRGGGNGPATKFCTAIQGELWNLVERVHITPAEDERGFAELPPNSFHRKDRKFLAVAVVARAQILNVSDSDWDEHSSLMDELGVVVEQVCPQHMRKKR